jgi:hypothetical protein
MRWLAYAGRPFRGSVSLLLQVVRVARGEVKEGRASLSLILAIRHLYSVQPAHS